MDTNGLCEPCHDIHVPIIENIGRIITESMGLIHNSKSASTRLSRIWVTETNAERLRPYYEKGIPTIAWTSGGSLPPDELIAHATGMRRKVIQEFIAEQADTARDRARTATTLREKLAGYDDALKALDRLMNEVQDVTHLEMAGAILTYERNSIRFETLFEKAVALEEAGELAQARTAYETAVAALIDDNTPDDRQDDLFMRAKERIDSLDERLASTPVQKAPAPPHADDRKYLPDTLPPPKPPRSILENEIERASVMQVMAEQNSDLISGWRLHVTMSTRTPLKWLLRFGEIHDGHDYPREIAPMQHAIWVTRLKPWRELGIDIDELPPSTIASDIGPIPGDGGDFLPFLISYRRIIESDSPRAEVLACLRQLNAASPDVVRHFGGDIARYFVIDELQTLDGCGPAIADRLFGAGFTSADEVRAAPLERFKVIKGLGPKTIARLQGNLDAKS
ncbi:helix-hairpin-helix domain-containing protein [Pseudochelatococcus lubricantis]